MEKCTMKLNLTDQTRSASDSRFDVNVLESIDDPLDPNGSGFEIDVGRAMSQAMLYLPDLKDAVFLADQDALEMIRRQDRIPTNPPSKAYLKELFASLQIEEKDGLTKMFHAALAEIPDEFPVRESAMVGGSVIGFVDGVVPRFREIPIVLIPVI
jgi:hypothetical protein